MSQAILTRYTGVSEKRPEPRVQAVAQAGRIYTAWDDSLGLVHNHRRAAGMLAAKFGWKGVWHGGQLPDGDFVWVLTESAPYNFTLVEFMHGPVPAYTLLEN